MTSKARAQAAIKRAATETAETAKANAETLARIEAKLDQLFALIQAPNQQTESPDEVSKKVPSRAKKDNE